LSERLQAAAWDLIPKLKGVPFERAWCGVRSATADGLPVVDRVPGCENLWVATGHHRNGVLLAPITGLLLAQWLTEGAVADELAPLRADRWSPGT
jgi:glycine oxidase